MQRIKYLQQHKLKVSPNCHFSFLSINKKDLFFLNNVLNVCFSFTVKGFKKKQLTITKLFNAKKKTYKQKKKIKHRPRKKLVRTHELYCFEKEKDNVYEIENKR